MKVIANIRYGVTHEVLNDLMAKLKETLSQIPLVKEPIDIYIDTFDKETFQLVIAYHLPHPLPSDAKLNALKRDINLKVFEIVSSYGIMGTPIGTS